MSNRVVFFGSGPVAAASLELLARDFEVEAVITKPQPPHHKAEFPVLALADKLGLRVLTARNRRELSELFVKRPVTSRLGIVIDYGILMDRAVLEYFPLGLINSHFSLLPRWCGADPISFTILEGDLETGVSLMKIVEKLDEGPLLAQRSLPIPAGITTPELTKQLIQLSHELMVEVLPSYVAGRLEPYPQSASGRTFSHKLNKKDGQIDWRQPAARIERQVRAFIEWPKSRAKVGSTEVIITKSAVAEEALKPGETKAADKRLLVGTAEKSLQILKLKPAGKPEMTAEAFLAGYKLN